MRCAHAPPKGVGEIGSYGCEPSLPISPALRSRGIQSKKPGLPGFFFAAPTGGVQNSDDDAIRNQPLSSAPMLVDARGDRLCIRARARRLAIVRPGHRVQKYQSGRNDSLSRRRWFRARRSLAINLYLARKFDALWPTTPQRQAAVDQWSLWAATTLEQPYVQWALHTAWLTAAERRPEVALSASDQLKRPLARIDSHLQHHDHLVGDHFTVADLNVASVIPMLTRRGNTDHPAFTAWLARCKSRPAFTRSASLP
ncbi:hypothetical protein BH10PSE17_BH10PSE17_32250 [soil metagenome]